MSSRPTGLDARVKLAYLVTLSVCAAVLSRPVHLLALFGFTTLVFVLVRPSRRVRWAWLLLSAGSVLGMVGSQALFWTGPPRTVLVHLPLGLGLSREGLWFGLGQAPRALAVLSATFSVLASTRSADLVSALCSWHVPPAFAFVLGLAVRFAADTVTQAQRLARALAMRSGQLSAVRRLVLATPPLGAKLLRRSEQVARAATLRGWDASLPPMPGPPLRRGDWMVIAGLMVLLFVALLGWWQSPPELRPLGRLKLAYGLSTAALVPAWWLLRARWRSYRVAPLDLRQWVILGLGICLLAASLLPFKGGLAKVPGLDALIYAIPYSTVLVLVLHWAPAPGAAAVLVMGQALIGQLTGSGLNPLSWPYYLWVAWAAEVAYLATGSDAARPACARAVAVARGAVSNGYSYALLAPLLWRKEYAGWYIALKVGLGLVGCLVGAELGRRVARSTQSRASHRTGEVDWTGGREPTTEGMAGASSRSGGTGGLAADRRPIGAWRMPAWLAIRRPGGGRPGAG